MMFIIRITSCANRPNRKHCILLYEHKISKLCHTVYSNGIQVLVLFIRLSLLTISVQTDQSLSTSDAGTNGDKAERFWVVILILYPIINYPILKDNKAMKSFPDFLKHFPIVYYLQRFCNPASDDWIESKHPFLCSFLLCAWSCCWLSPTLSITYFGSFSSVTILRIKVLQGLGHSCSLFAKVILC